VKIHRAH